MIFVDCSVNVSLVFLSEYRLDGVLYWRFMMALARPSSPGGLLTAAGCTGFAAVIGLANDETGASVSKHRTQINMDGINIDTPSSRHVTSKTNECG